MYALLMLCLSVSASSGKQLFNNGWRFRLGDIAEAKNEVFDDGVWRELTLPHDWSIEGRFDKDAPAGNDGGYLPAGIGWYRKTFELPKAIEGRKYQLYFEGIYMNSEVYVNGQRAGGHPYGYSSFFVDITSYVKTGKRRSELIIRSRRIAVGIQVREFTVMCGWLKVNWCTSQIGGFR